MSTRSSRKLWILTLVATAWTSGCTTSRPAALLVAEAAGIQRSKLDDLLQAYPLGGEQNIRADVVAQTVGSSLHLVQVRGREQPHYHAEHDLSVALLRGEGAIFLNGAPHEMHSGDVLVIPRGVPHFFVNLGSQPAVALVSFAPPYDGKDQVPVTR